MVINAFKCESGSEIWMLLKFPNSWDNNDSRDDGVLVLILTQKLLQMMVSLLSMIHLAKLFGFLGFGGDSDVCDTSMYNSPVLSPQVSAEGSEKTLLGWLFYVSS